jgi:hypothetical protein
MRKFTGIDLLDSLERIMKKNTLSYQGDFSYDRKELEEVAAKADALPFRERTYLWMSRRCGTWCLKERRVYLMETAAYNIWTYYGDGRIERILAYAVEVTGLEDGKVIGNLYPLDYREHVEYVRKVSVPVEKVRVVYENGEYYQEVDERIRKEEHKIFGKFLYSEYVPSDSAALETVLRQEERKREKMRCGKIENHIRNIRKNVA